MGAFFAVAAAALAIVLVIWFISVYNSLGRALVKVKETESGIDVALSKRYDVLTKQLDITKAYAKHEKDTLEAVINLRGGMSMSERNAAAAEMSRLQDRINLVAESYPELRSSENFRMLQASVNDVEEHLQAARRMYNAAVSAFNAMLVTFPSSIVAGMRKYTPLEFFEAEETKRADVKMQF